MELELYLYYDGDGHQLAKQMNSLVHDLDSSYKTESLIYTKGVYQVLYQYFLMDLIVDEEDMHLAEYFTTETNRDCNVKTTHMIEITMSTETYEHDITKLLEFMGLLLRSLSGDVVLVEEEIQVLLLRRNGELLVFDDDDEYDYDYEALGVPYKKTRQLF